MCRQAVTGFSKVFITKPQVDVKRTYSLNVSEDNSLLWKTHTSAIIAIFKIFPRNIPFGQFGFPSVSIISKQTVPASCIILLYVASPLGFKDVKIDNCTYYFK